MTLTIPFEIAYIDYFFKALYAKYKKRFPP